MEVKYFQTSFILAHNWFRLEGNKTVHFVQVTDNSYLQRPEAVESWFILWRITHNQKYRDWGWEYAQGNLPFYLIRSSSVIKDLFIFVALESTKRPNGYHGLSRGGGEDDVQQSFFLAETLKYLYLLFCSNDVLPLDQWTFTTEAHPLRHFNPRESFNLTLADLPILEPPPPPPVPPVQAPPRPAPVLLHMPPTVPTEQIREQVNNNPVLNQEHHH